MIQNFVKRVGCIVTTEPKKNVKRIFKGKIMIVSNEPLHGISLQETNFKRNTTIFFIFL